jgi:hypothetical protein
MAVNVLKQVRKKRDVKPKVTKKKKTEFSMSNPYSVFYDITLEEVSDIMNAYVNSLQLIKRDVKDFVGKFKTPELIALAKEKYQVHNIEKEIFAMHKIRNTIPMSHLLSFLKLLNPSNTASVALLDFYRSHPILINNMKRLIIDRKVTDIAIPHNKQIHQKTEIKSRRFVSAKQTKYDRKTLENMTLQEVAELADKEELSYKGTKKQIIKRLLDILEDIEKGVERKFDRELLPICETEYREAQWMKKFTPQRVVSMLVKNDNPYSTKFHARDGWYRVTSTFYREACLYGREFITDDVAYLLQSNDIIVETRAMYNESLLPVENDKETDIYVHTQDSGEKDIEPKLPVFQETEKIQQELAPGLFRYVKSIISGLSVCCDTCNLTVLKPDYKSIEGDKKVVFCSKKCFEEYLFGSDDN